MDPNRISRRFYCLVYLLRRGHRGRYAAQESDLIFFCEDKFQAGKSHPEYAQYWRENLHHMPEIALRLSAGMLPSVFFQNTNDPVELHDAKIQNATTSESLLTLTLHGNDNGGLRVVEIQYDYNGFEVPDIPKSLLENKPDCDLMCHEFIRQNHWCEHHMLFASGTEILIQFKNIVANFTPDRAS